MNLRLSGANVLMGDIEGRFDGHAHVFRAALPMASDRRYTPKYDAPINYYVDLLRGADLDGAILAQPSFLGTDNSYLIDVLFTASVVERLKLRGVAVLDPAATTQDLIRLSGAGYIGARLNLVGKPAPLDLDLWSPLIRRIDALGWHVEVNCEGSKLAPVLRFLQDRCARIVVDHFGLPRTGEPLNCPGQEAILAAQPGRVFVKASAPYRVFPELRSDAAAERCVPIFHRLFNHLGPERLLWGSDWPWTQYESEKDFATACAWEALWLEGLGAVA